MVYLFIWSVSEGEEHVNQYGEVPTNMIKRELNVKDSGTILQGHGGVLDRMDSLILAAPCYYIYLKFIMGING